ncbi:MAG: PIN domain-containing protein [Nanoarchaeota archaeon]
MRLIINTNRIIAALIKDSVSREIFLHLDAELITINFSNKEIDKYKALILKKARITEPEFNILLEKLKQKLILLDDKIILAKMEEAGKIMDRIDQDDTPFIAAALATGSDIWSDDTHFEKQKKIKVWRTKDLAGLI